MKPKNGCLFLAGAMLMALAASACEGGAGPARGSETATASRTAVVPTVDPCVLDAAPAGPAAMM
jgi:hypothetical protein